MSKAIKEKRKCYIEYLSIRHPGNISKRVIHPYEMMLLDNEWGVASFCEYKKDIRHFYLNRIKKIELLEEKY